jgi:cation diffusion facilitator family transporter
VTIEGPHLLLLLVVLAVNLFVTVYEHRMGRRLGSRILEADARHTLSDVWVTLLVLAGLFGVWIGGRLEAPVLRWLDVLLAFPVAMLVLKSGWEVLRDNLPWLVDEAAVPAADIQATAMQVAGVVNCHAIASRGVVGRQVFIEMHMVVRETSLAEAHRVTEAVEARLQEVYGPARITIHLEPPDYGSDSLTYQEPSQH